MGLGYDGDEEEVINKIAELEAENRDRDAYQPLIASRGLSCWPFGLGFFFMGFYDYWVFWEVPLSFKFG